MESSSASGKYSLKPAPLMLIAILKYRNGAHVCKQLQEKKTGYSEVTGYQESQRDTELARWRYIMEVVVSGGSGQSRRLRDTLPSKVPSWAYGGTGKQLAVDLRYRHAFVTSGLRHFPLSIHMVPAAAHCTLTSKDPKGSPLRINTRRCCQKRDIWRPCLPSFRDHPYNKHNHNGRVARVSNVMTLLWTFPSSYAAVALNTSLT